MRMLSCTLWCPYAMPISNTTYMLQRISPSVDRYMPNEHNNQGGCLLRCCCCCCLQDFHPWDPFLFVSGAMEGAVKVWSLKGG
jgi:hypothetical protein